MAANPKPFPGAVDRRFYTWGAIAAAVVVFSGFARTYYLKGAFGTPALSGLVHIHGLVMTVWFALFVAQVWLVAARRTDLHRRLGLLGALWSVLVFVVGVATAIAAARRGFTPGPPPLVFLSIPLGDMLVFAVMIAVGLYFRRRRDIHKRLMLLSTLGILTPAIARIRHSDGARCSSWHHSPRPCCSQAHPHGDIVCEMAGGMRGEGHP